MEVYRRAAAEEGEVLRISGIERRERPTSASTNYLKTHADEPNAQEAANAV